jgi:cytoskeletal protein RodZ
MQDDHSVLELATIRRNRGISLEQIAAATKISVRCLAAIEQGDFKKLPGGIYNTSYIRQYAKAIDYDETTILDYYHNSAGRVETAATKPSSSSGKGMFGGFRPASQIGH